MTQHSLIHIRELDIWKVLEKLRKKIFPVTLFISLKLDVYKHNTPLLLLLLLVRRSFISWYKCFAYRTSYSILYFSGLLILHTVPWRKRRKKRKNLLRGKSAWKIISFPRKAFLLFTLSRQRKDDGGVECRRWYSLVGLNIIYSTNIDFSWIEKHKRKTLHSNFYFFPSHAVKRNSINISSARESRDEECWGWKEEEKKICGLYFRAHKFPIQFSF